MRLLFALLSVLCLVAVISAKTQVEENIDPIEPETKDHSSKKYSKEFQKPHHHGHKHKKHPVAEELPTKPKEAEPKPKDTPVEVPEPEVKLQSDVETSKKAIKEEKRKAETEDLHLQDLAYEESLAKKDKKKKKKSHHGAHHAEVLEKPKGKGDHKLFAEQDSPAEKVIEDSFEPLTRSEKKGKGKDKKAKDKSKSKKKASDKGKGKKSREGKKNKDKSKKSKEGKRKW